MEYLDFYRIIKKDRLIDSIVQEKVPCKRKKLKKGKKRILDSKTILLIEKGVFLQYNPFRPTYFTKFFMQKDYVMDIVDPTLPAELEVVEDVFFREFEMDLFFDFLE